MIRDVKDITSFKWGTITDDSPLAVQLDGDTAPLLLVPETLVDPLLLSVGDRVRVELTQRKVVIHGVSGDSRGGWDPGDIKITSRSTASPGWLMAQGQSLLRADYSRLFAAIGTFYGSVDGTHFTLPNYKGRVLVGLDSGQTEFDTLGETGGAKTHALTSGELPQYVAPGNPGGFTAATTAGGATFGFYYKTAGSLGTGTAHNNLQPYAVVNVMIKY